MRATIKRLASSGLAAVLLCGAATAYSQGSLTPPGPPAPTMKSLDQVQPRAPISGQMFIQNPGSYYFVTNVVCGGGGYGLLIQCDNVTIDLNGFSLIGIPSSNTGILVNGSHTNIAVRNGSIRDWNGAGLDASQCDGGQFSELRVIHNNGYGLACGANARVEHCLAATNNNNGFQAGDSCALEACTSLCNTNPGTGFADGFSSGQRCRYDGCIASYNSATGIYGGDNCTLVNCVASANRLIGIQTGNGCTLSGCTATGNSSDGINVNIGCSITACTGSSNSGTGLSATSGSISSCSSYNNLQGGISTSGASTIIGCTANNNTGNGIGATVKSVISGCSATVNSNDGISVLDDCYIRDNSCVGNIQNGIHVFESGNRIEGNNSSGNATGIRIDAGHNIIIRNSCRANPGVPYSIAGTNTFAEVLSPTNNFVSTDPWANFAY